MSARGRIAQKTTTELFHASHSIACYYVILSLVSSYSN